jgi:DNA-binding MarR family transcriptional regulator
MTTDTAGRIIGYIYTNKQAKAIDLVRDIGITNAAVHRQLNKLMAKGEIVRVGKPPTVFYVIKTKEKPNLTSLPEEVADFIDRNYVYVSPTGELLKGVEGFIRWVNSIHQEKYLLSLAHEYIKVRSAADKFIRRDGSIDATKAKERSTFEQSAIDKLLYKDFYSLEKFGKTALGQMVLYAKISQNRDIISGIIKQVKPIIDRILQEYKIDAIGYIPPSVKRKVQLMSELKEGLKIHLPEISFVKAYTGEVIVSQKSLSKLSERIDNARNTIFIDVNKSALMPNNVLLIDDAVGSGATLHEAAIKVKELLHPKGKIIAFAVIGSIKSFEVIREI